MKPSTQLQTVLIGFGPFESPIEGSQPIQQSSPAVPVAVVVPRGPVAVQICADSLEMAHLILSETCGCHLIQDHGSMWDILCVKVLLLHGRSDSSFRCSWVDVACELDEV